jgi:CheY-like chemotaxis protein
MKTILIVDDELAIVDSLVDLLDDEGFGVITAPNGKVGLRKLEEELPDLIFIDIMMPVMDGREMLRRLREQPHYASIPVVMMSAVPMDVVFSESAKALGYSAFLRKPFDMKELLALIHEFLPEHAD